MILDLINQYIQAWPVFIYMPVIVFLVEVKKGKEFRDAFNDTLGYFPLMLLVFFILEALFFGHIILNQNSKNLFF